MRTTLTIDDDVLVAAKGLAAQQHKTVGEVVSALARQTLQRPTPKGGKRNGVPLLAERADAVPVKPKLVNQLRDKLP